MVTVSLGDAVGELERDKVGVAEPERDGVGDGDPEPLEEMVGVPEPETVVDTVGLVDAELEGVGELQTALLVRVHVAVVSIPLHELHTVQARHED